MPRRVRVEYEGAIYHVMNRGDRREPIFIDDHDRRCFLRTLGQACERTSWQVHALNLMSNHFHLVLETPRANLVSGMKWFLGTYTSRFNRRHKYLGHVFSGRYKALIVDGNDTGYLKTVCDYVHLNPLRAGLLQPNQPLREYRWSSWPEYLKNPSKRWPWLRVDRLMGEWGIQHDNAAGRRQLESQMEQRKQSELSQRSSDWQKLRRGWCLGPKQFRQELLELIDQKRGDQHCGQELRESDEQKAQRLVTELLDRAGWTEEDLKRRRKGDSTKAWIGTQIRNQTTMTWSWIARRLSMGHWRTAANAIRAFKQLTCSSPSQILH